MMPKKKMGRPLLPKGKVRDKIVALRLQPEERTAFEKAAQKRGLSLSDWIRQILNSALGHDNV
jgi:predicted HicB family RNase H-like nuclease